MKNLFILLTFIFSLSFANAISKVELEGAKIVANDGQFLGIISWNDVKSDCIFNNIGRYGSDISSTSIFNDICKYGSDISSLSPWNDIASNPPKIILRNNKWIYLTTNTLKSPSITPHQLLAIFKIRR